MNKKILVVEDNIDISYALQIMLKYSGYDVETINNGDETYDKVKEFQPDLILLDALLSGNDGQTIAKHLKSQASTRDILILMISAHPSAGSIAQEAGVDGFLPKPFGVDDLLGKMNELMRASEAVSAKV